MSKPTAATVHTELVRHEVECSERWKTNFKVLDQLQKEVTFIRNWMLGGLGTLTLTMFGYILSQV